MTNFEQVSCLVLKCTGQMPNMFICIYTPTFKRMYYISFFLNKLTWLHNWEEEINSSISTEEGLKIDYLEAY